MPIRRTGLIGAVGALSIALSVNSPAQVQNLRASRAIEIFTDSCAASVSDTSKLRDYLKSHYKRFPTAEREKLLLDGADGQVWYTGDAHLRDNQGIFSYDNGDCAVVATAPHDAAIAVFNGFIAQLKTTSKSVQLLGDTGEPDQPSDETKISYLVTTPSDMRVQYVLTMSTDRSNAQIIRLMAAPARK